MRRALSTSVSIAALIGMWSAASIGFVAARRPDAQRAPTPTPTPPVDLLKNGDFEGGFARQWNVANGEWANGRVALGWTAWWRKPTPSDGKYPGLCPEDDLACQPWHRPEYRETKGIPYTPPRVRSGDNSQMVFTSFGVHEGGLYQKVSGVPIGWRVRFSLWARAWSNDTEDTSQSSGQPSMRLAVGIDPAGGVDPWAETVVWGKEFESFDEFSQASIDVTAQAETVTVFFRSRPERALKHVDVMLDDARLIVIGPPPPTPVVIDSPGDIAGAPASGEPTGKIVIHVIQPGDTLFAIAQAYRADLSAIYALNGVNETSVLKVGQFIRVPLPVESAPTPIPTAPPAPLPPIVGTLCVSAFDDVAGDGRYNEGDGPLPGAAFIVADAAGRTVAASDAARCFANLPVGVYVVSAQAPAGYQATTETRWGVALTEGARVDVTAGGQRIDGHEPAAAEADAASASSITVGAAGGAVVIAAVMILIRRRVRRRRDAWLT